MANFTDKRQNEEMSMEDILASIRKYVSDEEVKKVDSSYTNISSPSYNMRDSNDTENFIKLDESHVVQNADEPIIRLHQQDAETYRPEIYEEHSSLSENVVSLTPEQKRTAGGPFDKLTDALKSYGKNNKPDVQQKGSNVTIDQFLSNIASTVIETWVQNNLRKLTEEIVLREIEKIKSE